NRFNLIGTVGLPFGWTASPSVQASSPTAFNITDGFDANGDLVATDRPGYAPAGACSGLTNVNKDPNIYCTKYGNFNTAPAAGDKIIPINYGNGFARWDADVRFSRTWGLGERRNVQPSNGGGGPGGPGGGGPPPGG